MKHTGDKMNMRRFLLTGATVLGLIFLLGACQQYENTSNSSDSSSSKGMIMENERVCVSNRSSMGWSQPYIMEVSVMKGHLLNEKDGYTGYDDSGDYVLIKGTNAVVELKQFHGNFTDRPVYGEDFRGRAWRFLSQYSCN